MPGPIPESHPLHRLFRGLTEQLFLEELGIGDPKLVGYVAELLARFVPATGPPPIRDVAGLVAEAESSPDDDRRRACHRRVGDTTLFYTGVFPEALAHRRSGPDPAGLVDYQKIGKISYYRASTYEGDEAPLFLRLSDEFEACAFGLSRVRREWERSGPPPLRHGLVVH